MIRLDQLTPDKMYQLKQEAFGLKYQLASAFDVDVDVIEAYAIYLMFASVKSAQNGFIIKAIDKDNPNRFIDLQDVVE